MAPKVWMMSALHAFECILMPSCQGAKPVPLVIALGLGLLLRFVVPVPVGITMQGWTLLSIFLSAIVGEFESLSQRI